MDPKMNQMLQLMDRPAFCVLDGQILWANQGALARMIPLNTPVAQLICAGKEEYLNFHSGWMYLTISAGGSRWGASVCPVEQYHVFTLEPEDLAKEFRSLALVAQELRNPLNRVLTMTERLFPSLNLPENSDAGAQVARINRGLHQMLRIVGNMSDAARYMANPPHLETRDVNALLQELFDQAEVLFQCAGISLSFTGLPAPVHSLVDAEQLERCVYNILSNSLKYGCAGGSVRASLTRRGNTLCLTVTDQGSGIDPGKMGDVFNRFLREPSLTDPDQGLGLGMLLIRACAKAHRGTVLISSEPSVGTSLTVSLPIRLDTTMLHSPRIRVDYAGERNHGLIELSDSLPWELYNSK